MPYKIGPNGEILLDDINIEGADRQKPAPRPPTKIDPPIGRDPVDPSPAKPIVPPVQEPHPGVDWFHEMLVTIFDRQDPRYQPPTTRLAVGIGMADVILKGMNAIKAFQTLRTFIDTTARFCLDAPKGTNYVAYRISPEGEVTITRLPHEGAPTINNPRDLNWSTAIYCPTFVNLHSQPEIEQQVEKWIKIWTPQQKQWFEDWKKAGPVAMPPPVPADLPPIPLWKESEPPPVLPPPPAPAPANPEKPERHGGGRRGYDRN